MIHSIEFVLEFIFLGTIDSISSKRVPMILRVFGATILVAIYFGLFNLLLIVGINTGNAILIMVAFVVLILVAVIVMSKIRQIKKQTK